MSTRDPWRVNSALLAAVHENARRGAMIRDWTGSRRAGRSGRAQSVGRGSRLQPDFQARRIPLSACVPACHDFRERRRSSYTESVADMQGPAPRFPYKGRPRNRQCHRFSRTHSAVRELPDPLLRGRERPTAVAADIGVSEMEVGGEPSVWHSLKLKRVSTFHFCPLVTDNQEKLESPRLFRRVRRESGGFFSGSSVVVIDGMSGNCRQTLLRDGSTFGTLRNQRKAPGPPQPPVPRGT
jgi:hypothetical protein